MKNKVVILCMNILLTAFLFFGYHTFSFGPNAYLLVVTAAAWIISMKHQSDTAPIARGLYKIVLLTNTIAIGLLFLKCIFAVVFSWTGVWSSVVALFIATVYTLLIYGFQSAPLKVPNKQSGLS